MRFYRFCFFIIPIITIISCTKKETAKTTNIKKFDGGKIFEYVDSKSSGIDFSNIVTEDFNNNILTNTYLYNGGGVGVLDVNNDDLQDLFFTSTQGTCKLYLNKGNLKFEDITTSAGVETKDGIKTGISIVDINGDGYDDIYVCRTGIQPNEERRNVFYINNKNNTFTNKAKELGLDDISASNQANFFDYDKDGDLDMYLINHPVNFKIVNSVRVTQENGQYKKESKPLTPYDSDRLYKNEGDKFTDVTEKAGITSRTFSLSVTASDFNNDGWIDIFIGNDYIEPDQLWINNKNGTFTESVSKYFRHMTNHTMGVDIADINNDGNNDIIALDMLADKETRRKELMTTMMEDRYSAMVKFGYNHQMMRNVLQLNNVSGTFSDIACLGGVYKTDWSWSPLLADFDNDGLKDLYITNGYLKDVSNSDYLMFTTDSINKAGGINANVFKSFQDYLKLIPTQKLNNYIFKNKDGLNFEDASGGWMEEKPSYSNGSAYADLDNDGDMDLIVNNYTDPCFLLKNTSNDQKKSNYIQIELQGTEKNNKGFGAKIAIKTSKGMQYEEMTAVRGYFSSSQPIFHFGLGNEKIVEKIEILWPDGKISSISNQEANKKITIKYAEAKVGKPTLICNQKSVAIFEEISQRPFDWNITENTFEDFNRERLLPHKLSNLGPCFATADINGDGLDDIYLGAPFGKIGSLLTQDKSGKFTNTNQSCFAMDTIYEDTKALFFDADGDKDLDLIVLSGGNEMPPNSDYYQHRLYINDGKGHFSRPIGYLPRLTISGGAVATVDYDKDGDFDLLIGGRSVPGAYPTLPNSYLLQNNNGKFSEVTDQVFPDFKKIGMVTDIKVADLNGDKNNEIIIAGEWMPISIFSINGGKFKNENATYGFENTNGWWNCLEIVDIDKDGDMDIVGGNFGTNSRLTASKEYPLSIYSKDFDNNGAIDPIITHWQDGIEYPLVMKDPLIKQIPSLRKKFLYYRDYAVASISDVFPEKDLKEALKLNVYSFSSTIFLNNNGKFAATILPTEAQIAPIQSIISTDVNKDGKIDLIMVGNNYGMEVETGRMDALNGVVLLGNGNGTFEFSPNFKNGFWANKDARQISMIKVGGKNNFLVANNNDSYQYFKLIN